MSADRRHVLAELPLPLGQDAGTLEAIEIAVAVEDGYGVTLPDELITVDRLSDRASVEAVLRNTCGRP